MRPAQTHSAQRKHSTQKKKGRKKHERAKLHTRVGGGKGTAQKMSIAIAQGFMVRTNERWLETLE
jgi:hypothetical protein